jgi:hypothetical protein
VLGQIYSFCVCGTLIEDLAINQKTREATSQQNGEGNDALGEEKGLLIERAIRGLVDVKLDDAKLFPPCFRGIKATPK